MCLVVLPREVVNAVGGGGVGQCRVSGGCGGGAGSGRRRRTEVGWCRCGLRSTRRLERSTMSLVWGRQGALRGMSSGFRKSSRSNGGSSEGGFFVSFSAVSGCRILRQGEGPVTEFRIRYCRG